jgi:DNA primase
MADLKQTQDILKPKLLEFVQRNPAMAGQIKQEGSTFKFRCPNYAFHRHGDRNPSATISPGQTETYHCFTCDDTGNIFHLNNKWFNAPILGKDFISNNVNDIAQQFNVPPVEVQFSQEDIEKNEMYTAMRAIKTIMAREDINDTRYAEHIGLTRETCLALCIGTFHWDDIQKAMREICSHEFRNNELMKSLGIHKGMFGPSLITLVIFDEDNRPVSLASRDMKYNSDFESIGIVKYTDAQLKDMEMRGYSPTKWKNSRSTIIYHKKELLYGFHLGKRSNMNKMYIFEGYWDFAIAHQQGLDNCCSIAGLSFTEEHIELLLSQQFTKLVLAFDNDEAGTEKAKSIVSDHVKPGTGFSISIMEIPESEYNGKKDGDPDTFILANGVKAFKDLAEIDAFEFSLRTEMELGGDPQEMVVRMLPIVCSYPDAVTQDKLLISLANTCNISLQALREDRARIVQSRSEEIKKKAIDIVNRASKDFLRKVNVSLDNAKLVMDQSINDLNNIVISDRIEMLGSGQSYEEFTTWSEENTKLIEDPGWRTGFRSVDDATDLIPKRNAWLVVPGAPNHGKSAFLYCLVTGMCASNDGTNLSVLLLSLDDSAEVCFWKIVALVADVTIKQVRMEHRIEDEETRERIRMAKNKVAGWIKEKRLLIKDARIGTSPQNMKQWVEVFQREEPTRSPVLFLDNFHCFDCGERAEWIAASKMIHSMKTTHNMSFISTMEITKGHMDFANPEFFLNMDAIAESGKMVFDSNVIMTVNSEWAAKPDKTKVKYRWYARNGEILPLVRVVFAKNKISTFKSSIWFKFDPAKGRYTPIDIKKHMLTIEAQKYHSKSTKDNEAF